MSILTTRIFNQFTELDLKEDLVVSDGAKTALVASDRWFLLQNRICTSLLRDLLKHKSGPLNGRTLQLFLSERLEPGVFRFHALVDPQAQFSHHIFVELDELLRVEKEAPVHELLPVNTLNDRLIVGLFDLLRLFLLQEAKIVRISFVELAVDEVFGPRPRHVEHVVVAVLQDAEVQVLLYAQEAQLTEVLEAVPGNALLLDLSADRFDASRPGLQNV